MRPVFSILELRNIFKYPVRALFRTPGLTSLAILSVALGIGANVTIFALLNALLLRPIPGVRAPSQLVQIEDAVLPSNILDGLRSGSPFAGACGFTTPLLTVEIDKSARPVSTLAMTGECFAVLGVRARIGRLLGPEDDASGNSKVAVITDAFWRGSLGARGDPLGSTIRIGGAPFTIVGVAQPPFQGLLLGFPAGIMIPANQDPAASAEGKAQHRYPWVQVFLRLAPHQSITQAQAWLSGLQRRLLESSAPAEFEGDRRKQFLSHKLSLAPAGTGLDYMLRKRFGAPLKVLLGICGLVLLISCLNLANLLLTRGIRRRREIALRLAMGAHRSHIFVLLASESFLIVGAGSALGLTLASVASRLITERVGAALSNFELSAATDMRVIVFMLGAALFTAIVFGVIPAWRSSDVKSAEVLKSSGRSVAQTRRSGVGILITAQVALTLALVTCTAQSVSSLVRLERAPLGFRPEGIIEAQLFPISGSYRNVTLPVYYRNLLQRVETLPGVESASLSNFAPLSMSGYAPLVDLVDRRGTGGVRAQILWVTDGFLRTMGIPLVSGRDFSRMDPATGVSYAILSQSLARRIRPEGDIVGRHLRIGDELAYQDLVIIGISADARLTDPRDNNPATVFLNFWQHPNVEAYPTLVLRGNAMPPMLIGAIREEIRREGQEYVEVAHTLDEQREDALLEERLMTWLASAFGLLALILAAVGLYALLTFYVVSRTNEIGIRVALGAGQADVLWLVCRQALVLIGLGFAIGVPLAFGAGRVISGLVYGTRAYASVEMAASIITLLLVAAAATWGPVRRACRVDPIDALRQE